MSRAIGSGLKEGLLEAFSAAAALVPTHHRRDFVLIGGTALLTLGSTRFTEDVDVAITPKSLNAFEIAAWKDSRFAKDNMHTWTYHCTGRGTIGLQVPFEFLAMGKGFVKRIRKPREVSGGGYRASLAELAVMKADAIVSRGELKDQLDFAFLLKQMEESGEEGFAGLELTHDDRAVLEEAAKVLGAWFRALLERLLEDA